MVRRSRGLSSSWSSHACIPSLQYVEQRRAPCCLQAMLAACDIGEWIERNRDAANQPPRRPLQPAAGYQSRAAGPSSAAPPAALQPQPVGQAGTVGTSSRGPESQGPASGSHQGAAMEEGRAGAGSQVMRWMLGDARQSRQAWWQLSKGPCKRAGFVDQVAVVDIAGGSYCQVARQDWSHHICSASRWGAQELLPMHTLPESDSVHDRLQGHDLCFVLRACLIPPSLPVHAPILVVCPCRTCSSAGSSRKLASRYFVWSMCGTLCQFHQVRQSCTSLDHVDRCQTP